MKKAIVLYDTMFGNTEKIARALARGIEKQGIKVDCKRVDEINIDNLVENDLLAIGGPNHRGGVSAPMMTFLEKLKNLNLKGKEAFAFDTRRNDWLAGSAGKEIERRLKRLQMRIVKPHLSAIVFEEEMGSKQESESKEEWKKKWHESAKLQEGMEEMFEQIGVEIAVSIK